MASQNDKLDADAKRASTRSFPGYVLDRALGRADFKKESAPEQNKRAAPLGSTSVMQRREKAAGLKDGGMVKMTKTSSPHKCK